MEPIYSTATLRAALAVACAIVIHPAYGEHQLPAREPTNPTYPVPETTYRSVLPGTQEAYLRETDAPRLPWRRLFHKDGRFVPEATLRGEADTRPPSTSVQPEAVQQATPAGSDMRAVIRSINAAESKVKLKHGPIERLGMPGMTMVFRVKDPAILQQVKEGDEVGVTVEMDGSRFFVTGFQK